MKNLFVIVLLPLALTVLFAEPADQVPNFQHPQYGIYTSGQPSPDGFKWAASMGIKTVMITGDNPQTAAAVAAEAGVDDFLAEATPEAKLKLIRNLQGEGRLVAMTGDGTNDAPALAQADVAVAMNTGTQAAKEAGNLVDLDSNPTKLIEIVEIGKQLLMTRGALTTFSIANDVAKYFAIIPAAFATTYPALNALNVMHLATPQSAVLSAVIFNALIIIALIPLALQGIAYRPIGAGPLLRRHLLIYGLGGILVPFIGIKLIDELDLKLVKAVDTHLHADHITGLGALRDRTHCITVMGEMSKVDVVSMRVAEGDKLKIEGLVLDVLYTPGHTDDSYSFLMGDRVFTGDTLLIRGSGRTDFQNGDPFAAYRSITEVLLRLPDDTLVFPGHGPQTTIGEERETNPFLR